jgi:hypothetical protein
VTFPVVFDEHGIQKGSLLSRPLSGERSPALGSLRMDWGAARRWVRRGRPTAWSRLHRERPRRRETWARLGAGWRGGKASWFVEIGRPSIGRASAKRRLRT